MNSLPLSEFGPGCGRPSCICNDPTRWPVCDEWAGSDDDRWCPCCGWSRAVHENGPPPDEEGAGRSV